MTDADLSGPPYASNHPDPKIRASATTKPRRRTPSPLPTRTRAETRPCCGTPWQPGSPHDERCPMHGTRGSITKFLEKRYPTKGNT